jgi:hypothetical protein
MVWDVDCWWIWCARIPRARCRGGLNVVVLDVNFHADPDNFFSGLSKECALLALKVTTRGAGTHFRKIIGRGRGKHCHQVMT